MSKKTLGTETRILISLNNLLKGGVKDISLYKIAKEADLDPSGVYRFFKKIDSIQIQG